MRHKRTCDWMEGVVSSDGTHSVWKKCARRAQFLVQKDGVEIGRVCWEHHRAAELLVLADTFKPKTSTSDDVIPNV